MRTLSCTQIRYFNGEALYEIPYNSAYNFFSNFKYIRKYLQNCVWLSYLFPFQKPVNFGFLKQAPALKMKRPNICYVQVNRKFSVRIISRLTPYTAFEQMLALKCRSYGFTAPYNSDERGKGIRCNNRKRKQTTTGICSGNEGNLTILGGHARFHIRVAARKFYRPPPRIRVSKLPGNGQRIIDKCIPYSKKPRRIPSTFAYENSQTTTIVQNVELIKYQQFSKEKLLFQSLQYKIL